MTAQELTALVKSWQSGAVSQETMHDLLRKGEIIPDGRSNEEEAALIKAESREQGAGSAAPDRLKPGHQTVAGGLKPAQQTTGDTGGVAVAAG